MADSIEAFVAKLQTEGVQAGQAAADRLLADARKQAEQILADAQARAAKVLEDAKAQAAGTIERSQTDLRLAARDTALRLRDALARAVQAVLAHRAEQHLTDAEFLKPILHDIVMAYVQADLNEKTEMRINVAPEMQQHLAAWALEHLHEKVAGSDVSLDLKGTLATAGFEYEVRGGTVEVTLASVVESLSELVNPNLREMLDQAMAEPKP